MAERYQVRGLRIWDSETDTYSMLFESEGDAKHVIGWLTVDAVRLQFRPLDQWQDDKPASDQVEQPANDPVNNPSHYTQSGIQCDDAIRAMLGPEGYEFYVRGTMTAYLWRLPHKGQAVLDAGKIRRYSDWLLEIVNQIHQ
jgi:hypothetical protein